MDHDSRINENAENFRGLVEGLEARLDKLETDLKATETTVATNQYLLKK